MILRALTAICLAGALVPSRAAAADLLERAPDRSVLETRHFRFGHGDRQPLKSGWSRDERDVRAHVRYVWVKRKEARFRLAVVQPTRLQMLVRVRPFPTQEPQILTVRMGEDVVHRTRLEDGFREYRWEVDENLVDFGLQDLVFEHSLLTRASPRDSRSFAAGYAELWSGPACLRLRDDGPPLRPNVRRVARGLDVIGPAVLEWDVASREDASVEVAVSLHEHAEGDAIVALIDDLGRELAAERLADSWFGKAEAVLRADLPAAASGSDVRTVRLRITPVPCETATSRVRVTGAETF